MSTDRLPARHQIAMLNFLKDLIAIPSVKGEPAEGAPFGVETRRALDLFLEHASALGLRTKNLDGYCGYAEYGPEDAPLIMGLCHLDVVPAGDWQEAFDAVVTEDRIIGRGSGDDKGPAISVLYAIQSLKDEGFEPDCRLRILVGLDEESGSACMAHYNAVDEKPVAAFTADADFPVIHAEKGRLTFRLNWTGDAAKAGDAARLQHLTAGTRPNVIPGSAICRYTDTEGAVEDRTIEGKAGHASAPQVADNAIHKAIRFMADDETGLGEDPFVRDYLKVLGSGYDGQSLGIDMADEVSGPLTLNVGIVEYDGLAGQGSITCDVRYPVTADIQEIREAIRHAVKDTGFDYEELTVSPPLHRSLDDPLVTLLQDVYNQYTGETTKPIAIGGGTYARSVANTLAFGPNFPGDESLAHQTGEYITKHAFFDGMLIYREAFRALAEYYGKDPEA